MKEEDFNKVVEMHYKNILAQAYKHLKGDISTAQDIAQRVFLVYFEKGHQYKGDSKLSVWLYSVCRNECNMYFRKKAIRVLLSAKDITDVYEGDLPSCDPIEPISENLKKAFSSLPKLERRVLELTMQGYPASQVALILSLTIPAIKSRLHRARLRVKASLRRKPKHIEINMPTAPSFLKKKKAKIIEMPHRKGRPKPPRFYTEYKKAANG